MKLKELSLDELVFKLCEVIVCDDEGDYFICKENSDLVDELFERTKVFNETSN